MPSPIVVAKNGRECVLPPQMANRHGLIAGATGTGKTITLQLLAEEFSRRGVPVFLADVKGDLAGISQPGGTAPKLVERARQLGLEDYAGEAFPVAFWDVFGEAGHPVRTTVSEMGPLLLGRLLNLNETQAGTLALGFKVADDNGLLLLDLKDLRALLQFLGDHASQLTTAYGHISAASIGAIQRSLLALEQQGGDRFFAEPALNLDDFLQTDAQGRGVINILAADRLMTAPRVYSTMLLWLLAELFERLPEAGDLDQPRLVFFFDEAHLLFNDLPRVLAEKIEQVVRLIRSRGVGVFFVTQNPRDLPEAVLGQLGNRVQHALRAFTPNDQKAVQAAARTFRQNPALDTATVLTELGVGEALVSFLDDKGQPGMVERAWILPPRGLPGPIPPSQRRRVLEASPLYGVYEKTVDRESAYERLQRLGSARQTPPAVPDATPAAPATRTLETLVGGAARMLFGDAPARSRRGPDGLLETMAKSAARSVGTRIGTQIVRGVLGSLFGGTSPRR